VAAAPRARRDAKQGAVEMRSMAVMDMRSPDARHRTAASGRAAMAKAAGHRVASLAAGAADMADALAVLDQRDARRWLASAPRKAEPLPPDAVAQQTDALQPSA
jgi:hypothetical protein